MDTTRPPRAGAHRTRRAEARFGLAAIAPAALLLLIFLVIPTLLAFALSFTNAKLISQGAPEFVGIQNFQRLLGVEIATVDAERDASGAIERDDDGEPVYPSARELQAEADPVLKKSELGSWQSGDASSKTYLLVGDPIFWKALLNTFLFVIVVVPVQAGLALALALFVNLRMRGSNLFRTVIFIPVVTSMVVVSILWLFMYQRDGLINQVLASVIPGYEFVDWLANPQTALPSIIVMSIWQAVGFHMIIWLSGLQTIPGELYEAARLDGAGAWRRFTSVTWPGLRHTAVFVLITITIAALGLFVQINVMTQGGPLDSTQTLVFHAFTAGYGKQQMGYGSAIAVVFFVLVLTISLIQRRLTREKD